MFHSILKPSLIYSHQLQVDSRKQPHRGGRKHRVRSCNVSSVRFARRHFRNILYVHPESDAKDSKPAVESSGGQGGGKGPPGHWTDRWWNDDNNGSGKNKLIIHLSFICLAAASNWVLPIQAKAGETVPSEVVERNEVFQLASLDNSPPERYELNIMKRLLQEIFADLLAVRSRLDGLESHTGVVNNIAGPAVGSISRFAPSASALGGGGGAAQGRPGGMSDVTVGGRACSSGGMFLSSLPFDHPVMQRCRAWCPLRTGTDAVVSFSKRGFRSRPLDTLTLSCVAGDPFGAHHHLNNNNNNQAPQHPTLTSPSSSSTSPPVVPFSSSLPLVLHKVQYHCQLASRLALKLIPMGGTGADVGPMLNPHNGVGLSQASSGGSGIFHAVGGCGVAAESQLGRSGELTLGAAHFHNSDQHCPATLVQAVVRPTRFSAVGVSLLHRSQGHTAAGGGQSTQGQDFSTHQNPHFIPFSPPLGGKSLRRLDLSPLPQRSSQVTDHEEDEDDDEAGGGRHPQMVSMTGILGIPRVATVSGWMAGEVQNQGGDLCEIEWGVGLSPPPPPFNPMKPVKPSTNPLSWGLAMGQPRRVNGKAIDGLGDEKVFQAEGFLQWSVAEGVTLVPGFVHMRPVSSRPGVNAFILRSQCRF